VKLKHLDDWTDHRIKIANTYLNYLSNNSNIVLPVRKEWAKQVYHLFVVRSDYRDEIKKNLLKNGFETSIHYPISLPKLEAYKYLGQSKEKLFAWECGESILSLPIGEHISELDVSNLQRVINI